MAAPEELQKDFLSLDSFSDEEELNDERIAELLLEAEARLREKAVAKFPERATNATGSRLPKLNPGSIEKPYVSTDGGIAKADSARLLDPTQRKLASQVRKVEDPVMVKKRELETKKATAGPEWFNLPRTDLTPELKRDLQLLKMRSVLDPKRHYRKETGKSKAPEFAQVGTIIEGPTEFFSARLTNKERKKTLVEEILDAEREGGRFKRKYNEIQEKKMSGKRGHYNALRAKRTKQFKRR